MSRFNPVGEIDVLYRIPLTTDGPWYYVPVQIGSPPQSFNLMLDTGSSLSWIQSTDCDQHPTFCNRAPKFNTSQSSTLIHRPESVLVKYTEGIIRAQVVADVLTLGTGLAIDAAGPLPDWVAKDQEPSKEEDQRTGNKTTRRSDQGSDRSPEEEDTTKSNQVDRDDETGGEASTDAGWEFGRGVRHFGLTNDISGDAYLLTKETHVSGFLGASQQRFDPQSDYSTHILPEIVNELAAPVFSLAFADSWGTLTLGGPDPAFYAGPLTWIRTLPSEAGWVTSLSPRIDLIPGPSFDPTSPPSSSSPPASASASASASSTEPRNSRVFAQNKLSFPSSTITTTSTQSVIPPIQAARVSSGEFYLLAEDNTTYAITDLDRVWFDSGTSYIWGEAATIKALNDWIGADPVTGQVDCHRIPTLGRIVFSIGSTSPPPPPQSYSRKDQDQQGQGTKGRPSRQSRPGRFSETGPNPGTNGGNEDEDENSGIPAPAARLELTPAEYIIGTPTSQRCFTALNAAVPRKGHWIFGLHVLRGFYTVYHYEHGLIGIAPYNITSTNPVGRIVVPGSLQSMNQDIQASLQRLAVYSSSASSLLYSSPRPSRTRSSLVCLRWRWRPWPIQSTVPPGERFFKEDSHPSFSNPRVGIVVYLILYLCLNCCIYY